MPTSSLAYFSACIPRRHSREPGLAWPMFSALSPVMAAASGLRLQSTRALRSISRYQTTRRQTMTELKPILLAEDNPKDVELTLEALAENNLANRVTVVNDGVEAMAYLRCEGKYRTRRPGNPAVVVLDIKMPRMDGIEVLRAIRSDQIGRAHV